ncbi:MULTISPECIES: hypothetical protein [Novosphingobium]|jgi:hypothetical protein|uniref:hypothetical protein n=1 Tax=Novosphingobium TaxID=165696 RepID=UPI0022F25685|nr:hypothetical protein [Novosphingobium resinovorum]GLK46515.1 hypothetical protein GCM10017612_44370 [Novosphingobium resinovorum]
MSTNPVEGLLALWEAGTNPLALLRAAEPGAGDDALARLPIGARDGKLIAHQRRLFGPAIEATVPCHACGETAEVTLDADSLLAMAPQRSAPILVTTGAWRIEARPADSRDMAVLATEEPEAAERALLARVVTLCTRDGAPADPANLPPEVVAAIEDALEAADPLAAITLLVACPHCGASIPALHDPAHHLARSVAAEARRLLAEVAALARAYGWREADILAMTPQRRAAYLELAA